MVNPYESTSREEAAQPSHGNSAAEKPHQEAVGWIVLVLNSLAVAVVLVVGKLGVDISEGSRADTPLFAMLLWSCFGVPFTSSLVLNWCWKRYPKRRSVVQAIWSLLLLLLSILLVVACVHALIFIEPAIDPLTSKHAKEHQRFNAAARIVCLAS